MVKAPTRAQSTSPAPGGAARRPAAGRRTSADDVAVKVREQIQGGRLAPGEWLREVRLCEDFGVGRSTVREALRTLSDDGLVKFERNRGAYVASITLHEMFDLFEVRAALYGLAARFACFRASDPLISEIRAKISKLVDAAERATPADERIRLGGEIFALLAETASPDAQKMIETIGRKSRWHYSYVGLAESPGSLGPVDDWRALADALAARDSEPAASSARQIIYFMQQEVMRVMVARGLGPPPQPPDRTRGKSRR